MPSLRAVLNASFAAAALLLATAPVTSAATPVLRASASISPNRIHTAHGSVGTPIKFQIHTTFSTDPPGAPLFTVQHADIFFPAGFVANGRLFPSCSAKQIERLGKILSRCPKGSRIGSGKVTADAIQLGVTSQARVAIFNSNHGKSATLNIQASIPANINESFDAPLVRVHGRYAYKLTLAVPPSLQQILTGVYVGLKRFDISVGATRRVHGRTRGFAEALSCPRSGKVRGHGDVDLFDSTTGAHASASVDTNVRCVRA
jgi:hypothetical protein